MSKVGYNQGKAKAATSLKLVLRHIPQSDACTAVKRLKIDFKGC